jgi:hypothetical protein
MSEAELRPQDQYPNDGLYGPANAAAGAPPEFARGNVVAGRAARDAAVDDRVNIMTKNELAVYIIQNDIVNPATWLERDKTKLKSKNTIIIENSIETLRDIVRDHMNSALNLQLAGSSGIGEGK